LFFASKSNPIKSNSCLLPGAFFSSLAAGAEAGALAAAPLVEPPAATVLAMTAGVMLEV